MTAFSGMLIATSVVRGSQQGDSHGGVYLIDFAEHTVTQTIDWNTSDIDFQGRGWDRGLRGIEFDDGKIYIVASDELFVYDAEFVLLGSYRNAYLKHAHEICRFGRNLFITSTGFNSVLAFDLDKQKFTWGLHLQLQPEGFVGTPFDPMGINGPAPGNQHHINNVYCDDTGMYISGRGTKALLRFDGTGIHHYATLPVGVHNAQLFGNGVLFNDTENDRVCFHTEHQTLRMPMRQYSEAELTHTDFDDTALARQGFARGLCVISDNQMAVGSSPSTITIYDLEQRKAEVGVNITMDVRNAIHGLELWPY